MSFKSNANEHNPSPPEQIKGGSTGSMLQEHFMISGTFESETHKNKQPDLIINNIYEYH